MTRLLPATPLLVLLVLGGCAGPVAAGPRGPVAYRIDPPAEEHEPLTTDPQTIARARDVRVLATGSLPCSTEALGPVDVHEQVADEDSALEILKLRAAALGAEAIVHVEFEHGEAGAPTHLSGLAIRCHDVLHGRRYDVIGEVEIDAPMGDEEAAFHALLDTAARRGANVVLHVEFEHGEGANEITRVHGLAVHAFD